MLRKLRFNVIFVLLSFFLFIHESLAIQELNFLPGMELGRGLNILSGEVRGSCVTRSDGNPYQGGQETRLSIDRIESKEQLRKLTGLDAQASLRGFGSAKVSYF